MRRTRTAALSGLLAALIGCGDDGAKQPKAQNNPDIQFKEMPTPAGPGGGGGGPAAAGTGAK